MPSQLLQFKNCRILRNHHIIWEDLWVRNGQIVNPEKIFYDEKIKADRHIDCKGVIIAPGLIDLQINGGFGIDFSTHLENVENGINKVAKGLLMYGVTSFCPTVVTSPVNIYHKILPNIKKRKGGKNGAAVLGLHLEGPFISIEKKGAHPPQCIKFLDKGFETIKEVYGCLDNVSIITMAPELENSAKVIKTLVRNNIVVSLGHSMGNLRDGERAVSDGASFITHLFNAMLPFHHRDPGLVGLLTSDSIPEERTVYFGIIADGVHTHPSALRIAHRAHPKGLVLVTDAISPMGFGEGVYNIGQMSIEIRQNKAYVVGTNTLCGSIATMIECVKLFQEATDCSVEYALEAGSLHPACVLGISDQKGTLNYGSDADFIFLDDNLNVLSTYIAGECVYEKKL
ncbi:N-acetylglucosamine-6-phosphate deacetylase [Agrilus planipennis]|uniref:N-acetylglucosamine-6-phosphate deacetylase n=1 Tax=Agrilus planipennis TaxID=224129 RepID=A0A7F5RL52_AGRPL|nr:N-acetylglucosamine-6-phosphate deacetylase [Agrilus planipennis]